MKFYWYIDFYLTVGDHSSRKRMTTWFERRFEGIQFWKVGGTQVTLLRKKIWKVIRGNDGRQFRCTVNCTTRMQMISSCPGAYSLQFYGNLLCVFTINDGHWLLTNRHIFSQTTRTTRLNLTVSYSLKSRREKYIGKSCEIRELSGDSEGKEFDQVHLMIVWM